MLPLLASCAGTFDRPTPSGIREAPIAVTELEIQALFPEGDQALGQSDTPHAAQPPAGMSRQLWLEMRRTYRAIAAYNCRTDPTCRPPGETK
jgi:hypothetical protein